MDAIAINIYLAELQSALLLKITVLKAEIWGKSVAGFSICSKLTKASIQRDLMDFTLAKNLNGP